MLLNAVRLLHERGYELLRINPTFYATGHWRCSLRSGQGADHIVHLQYTNDCWWDVFGDGLRLLTSQYRPSNVVVLGPWGSQSLATCIIEGALRDAAHADEVRWLRANLGQTPSR